MRFDNENLFISLVSQYKMNLFLGAGFSVYSYNADGESLPLGKAINKKLIELFDLPKDRDYSLSKTCQKIKKSDPNSLEHILKNTYTVKNFDEDYLFMNRFPINSIITLNIDNLIEKIYEDKSSYMDVSDVNIYGYVEKSNIINLYKLHGSVTYPMGSRLSFSDKELADLFLSDRGLFNTVSYKLASCPTVFWGTSLGDSNTLQLICSSEAFKGSSLPKWIVVYPSDKSDELIEDYEDLGFNIIEADTKELLQRLCNMPFVNAPKVDKYIYKQYRENFPGNFICNELSRSSLRRPVMDFFSGAEPQISDIYSENVIRTLYFQKVLSSVFSGRITLITGIPGCGKSTLLLQLAFADEIPGRKFWFNNIIKQEAIRLGELIKNDKQVIIFLDNLYSNIDAFEILKSYPNIKLVLAERALNYEYVKRFLEITTDNIVDVSNLIITDIQHICQSMNRSSSDALDLIEQNQNVSLLEIVFYISGSIKIKDKIMRYINDLKSFKDEKLKINLLELYTLVNYTSYCGIPISMDMLYFYFSDVLESYDDILYALKKMTRIIVETDDKDIEINNNQDYLVMRSKLYAEISVSVLSTSILNIVLNKFLDRVSPHIIYRYDIFKRKAYDADITKRAFSVEEGIAFYEKVLVNNKSPYIRHQYALFLQRKGEIDLSWKQIDQAYTECNKKIFSIANTHAIIMFERNLEVETKNDTDLQILKKTIEHSFDTLEYCITKDVRVNYHVLVYSRNALTYFNKYGIDDYSLKYINSAALQIDTILQSGGYIFKGTYKELSSLYKEIKNIQTIHISHSFD